MKGHVPVLIAGIVLLLGACAQVEQGEAARGVADAALGLSKTSVYDTPDPIVAPGTAKDPGENETVGGYFEGAPPVVPHLTGEFLPIMAAENMCLDCHDIPDQIGQPRETGDPTPAPETHYTDLRRSPGEVGSQIIGARYVCSQCHVPQADARLLVESTYRQ
jgi:cytochrome c-type protein NapB